jgi:hypothetical protein
MSDRKWLRVGGYISGGVLIVFGIVVIALGIWGISFTRDHLQDEGIVFGPASDPAVAEHAEKWAGEQVKTGSQALAFANVMREHTLESTNGLTYAEMAATSRPTIPPIRRERTTKPRRRRMRRASRSRTARATSGSRRPL